jgi:hypothetical protein
MLDRYGARVIDQLTVARAIAAITLVVLTATMLLVVAGVALRFANRVPGRRWSAALWSMTGVVVGLLFLQSTSDTVLRVAILVGLGGAVLWLLWRNRRVRAGLLVAGAALPWTVLWGFYLVLLLAGGADFAPLLTATMFVIGAVVTAVGVGLVLARDPVAYVGSEAPRGSGRRIGLVAQTVLAPEMVGSIPVSELAAMVVGVVTVIAVGLIGLPQPLEAVAQIAIGGLAGTEARLIVRPPRARRAYEAFSWLGEWELARVRTLTGLSVPTSPAAAGTWMRTLPERPDTDWLRVEVLCLLGRVDDARVVASRMPADTPYERFERTHAIDLVEWLAGGPGDPDAVRAAAEAVGDPEADERLRADVAVALREAARIGADHGPDAALQPLLDVRDRLGHRADGQLRRALWRRTLPISLVTAGFTAAILYPW